MIRKLSEKDMNEISEIWLSANLQAHDFVPDSYWTENLPFVKEMLPKAEVYVYKDEERKETAGFIGINDDYIEGIFVKSYARSKGIGKALLDYAKTLKVIYTYMYMRKITEQSAFTREKISDLRGKA